MMTSETTPIYLPLPFPKAGFTLFVEVPLECLERGVRRLVKRHQKAWQDIGKTGARFTPEFSKNAPQEIFDKLCWSYNDFWEEYFASKDSIESLIDQAFDVVYPLVREMDYY